MPNIPDKQAYNLFKRMHKKICPKCIGKDKKCPECEGEGYLFGVSDELLKEIKSYRFLNSPGNFSSP